MYRHRQSGSPLLGLVIVALILLFFLLPTPPAGEWGTKVVVACVIVVVALAAWFFSSLTITVDAERLHWSFGPGAIRNEVPLREIERAEPTRIWVLAGWGIHWTPAGWIYNVAGRDAVQVRMRSGTRFLLGTDEPEALAEAITEGGRRA